MRFLGTSRIILIKGSIYKNAHTHCKPLTFHAWLIKHDVSFRLFSLLFCYIIVTSKEKRILLFFGRVNKREEHRPQTETTEPTMLTKINWVILMTLLFLNFSQAKNSVSPKKLECLLENCWLGQNVPRKWNPT